MKVRLIELLKQHQMTVGSSEARRVAAQGAVRLNGILQTDMSVEVEVVAGDVLEVGRRKVEIK